MSEVQGSPTLEHGGGINGFLTQALYLPNEDVFVAVFSNSNAKSPNDVAVKMAALTIGKPYNYKEIQLEETTLENYTGVYENEEGAQRIITKVDKQLFSQRATGPKNSIKAYGNDKFFFTNSLATLTFQRDGQNRVTQVVSSERGVEVKWIKTDKPIPATND